MCLTGVGRGGTVWVLIRFRIEFKVKEAFVPSHHSTRPRPSVLWTLELRRCLYDLPKLVR